MSGESMAHKVISKVSARLKFLQRKNKYLRSNLCHLLCNALIQLILIMLAQYGILIFLKNYKAKFKLHKIYAFFSVHR